MYYNKSQIWIMASRPKTLPAAVSPVIVGSAFAIYFEGFNLLPALSALLGALLLQIAANFANDYYDFKKGSDTEERLGPTRVAASGLLSPGELFRGLLIVIIISILNGLYLIWVAGIVVLIIGFASIVSLMAYSGLSISYGYKGLGDIFVFVFFGLLAVNGTFYVQALEFNQLVLIGSIPAGCLITAILVVNNYRDMETDRKTGKNTLAVIIGKSATRMYFVLLFLTSYLVLFYLYFEQFGFSIFLPIIAIPLLKPIFSEIYSEKVGPTLNLTLAKTAKFGLIFNVLFSLGIIFA